MFYLGIYIGKNTHVAFLMNEKSNVIFKVHSFSDTSNKAASLLEKITPYAIELEIAIKALVITGTSFNSVIIKIKEQKSENVK